MQRLRLALSIVLPRNSDTATSAGRSAERYRLAALAALANLGSRGLSMVVVILSVNLTTHYLGVERFGVWATFASMVAMLSFLDLGVGNALVNRIAQVTAHGDERQLRTVISGGVALLLIIGLCSALLLGAVATAVPWARLFKLSTPALADEAARTAYVFAALFGINVISSGLLKLLAGQQQAHRAHVITACGSVAAAACLWLTASQQAGLPWLLAATFGVQSLAGLALLPRWAMCGALDRTLIRSGFRSESRVLLRSGSLFLLLQVGTMIGWGSDSILLAGVKGATEVAVYAIAQRLFLFASQPLAIANAPLWAAYADAMAKGDKDFIRKTFRRSMAFSVSMAAGLASILCLIGPWLLPTWTRDIIQVPMIVLAAFATWTVIEAGGTAFGTYLNGCGVVGEQVVVVVAFCALALPAKFLAASHAGAAGLLAATSATYVLLVVGLYGFILRRRVLAPLRDE